jgi:hypothetical protein
LHATSLDESSLLQVYLLCLPQIQNLAVVYDYTFPDNLMYSPIQEYRKGGRMSDRATVMLIGLGDLGGATLELLALREGITRIVVGSRDVKRGERRCNLVRLGAMAQGHHVDIQFVHLDLDQKDRAAETIFNFSPQIILSTASRMTWWYPELFPEEQRTQLDRIGFGAWLPVHLDLAMKWMQLLKLVNFKGHSLIASYPDVVCPVLKCRGLAPTAGFGNLDEVIPKVRWLVARKLDVNPSEVSVTLVAHHALEKWVFGNHEGKSPPYYLKVEHKGMDVTEESEARESLFSPYPMVDGPDWHYLSASSATCLVRGLLSYEEVFLHAPGPQGLPGGYPITVNKEGIGLRLPEDLPLQAAIEINRASHPFDGIQEIEPDGTVVFCQETVEAMRHVMGYECERLSPWEVEGRAQELIDRFHEYATRHRVNLPGSMR